MRVVHYYHWALEGEFGTALSLRGWCSALAERGVEVQLLAATARARIAPPDGVELVALDDRPSGVQPPGYLRRRFRRADLVVLHGGWEPSNLMAAHEARAAGTPYIWMPHGVYFPQVFRRRKVLLKRAWWTSLERPTLRRAFAIHLFFADEIAHLEDRGVRRPFIVAPNGFSAPPGITWSPGPEPYIVWLGRFDPEHKGLDLLLHAVHSLAPKHRPRLRLHGVDWKGRRADVTRLVAELDLGDHVSVLDPVYGNDKWTVLSQAQAFVYPSRWDASPISVVEALSIGVPALLTPFPLGSFVGSRGAALVSEPTVEALGDGLQRILRADAATYGGRAVELIGGELSWPMVADSWIEQVSRILNGSAPYPAEGPG